ncbi:MAG: ribosome maturation factor RimM [Rhodospirillales bacterium]
MGVVGKPHGVRGLLRVNSFTADPADLPRYNPLLDDRNRPWTLTWKGPGVAELRDADGNPIADRTAAEKLVNLRLHAPRDRLPQADEDDFYIADLIGLEAIAADRTTIGRITEVHDYGAGTSLEIASGTGPLLVPFTRACVPVVDIAAGQVTVLPPDEIEVREIEVREVGAREHAA